MVLDGYTVNPGDNPWTALTELGELTIHDRSAPSEVLERVLGAQIVISNKAEISAATLRQLPQLQGVSVLATGVNCIDLAAATDQGVPVCNVPSYSTASVVQHTLALLLELCHHVGRHDASVHAGDWQRAPDFCYWQSPLLSSKASDSVVSATARSAEAWRTRRGRWACVSAPRACPDGRSSTRA